MVSLREYLTSLPPVGNRTRPIGLVVQGGGMRGVYSMGALSCLHEQGLTRVFDVVLGSSAGAINAAYFLAGQADEAVRIYIDQLSNRNFINPWRINRIVDIDVLIDTLRFRTPLQIDTLTSSPTTLHTIVTNAMTAEPESFTNREELDFYQVFHATAALPVLYDKEISIRGTPYVDGGTVDGIPVQRAVEVGCRDIIAVLTRQPGFRRYRQNWAMRTITRAMARRQSRAVKETLGEEDHRYNAAMDLLEGKITIPDGLRSWVVSPTDMRNLVGRTTFDRQALERCSAMGYADMSALLSRDISNEANAPIAVDKFGPHAS